MISALLFAVALAAPSGESDSSPSAGATEFFEKRIRPLLIEHCYSCHSAESDKVKGGLRLDSRDAILQGGDSGPAAVPGDPEESLLLRAVRYTDRELQMPPRKGKLPDPRIEELAQWIRAGLPWPAESKTSGTGAKPAFAITDEHRAYWAFQPVHKPALPSVLDKAWPKVGLDAFVLAALEAKGLHPNPPATRRELGRRVYFDLLGVPPRPEELAAFEGDPDPEAYERLVDRLLCRPEYGERWARHWLDVVRYAQSNGYERDSEKPLAWRYRDYVIDSLNQDKPYSRFLEEQIAGDELPDATADSVVATGFQRLGVWDDEPDDPKTAEYDALDDVISTTGAAMLGLTLGCARCHDHKFDPISQADYYQLLAFFRNVRPNEAARYELNSPNYLPLAPPRVAREVERARKTRRQALESRLACANDPVEKGSLERSLKTALEEKLPFEWALGVREWGGKPLATHVLIRGNAHTPGPEVEPGFLTVLGGEKPVLPSNPVGAESTGRRRALARWIASPANPLTARVAVNRVWHHHFGQGIVKTTTDFGRSGTAPTHPELLNWLAAEFVEEGWSLKRLHRLILLSRTYQMSSRSANATALAVDPGNDLLWRQRLRRLDAEALWDSALSVSGELSGTMRGRGFFPYLEGEVLAGSSRPGLDWDRSSAGEQARRSIYTFIRRTTLVPLLEAFDYNNTSSSLGERPTTTVAPQALMLLNSRWAQDRAQAFAKRLSQEVGMDRETRVRRAYQLALGRLPSAKEIQIGLQFISRQSQEARRIQQRLTFRPDAPNALFAEYMALLKPSDLFRGPEQGWDYYMGRWSGAYEGIRAVDRQRGPFALWTGRHFSDGNIHARLLLHPASESGSLLLRSTAEKGEHRGYEVLFDPRQQRVAVLRHGQEIEVLGERSSPVPTAAAFGIRIALEGARIRVWMQTPAPTSEAATASEGAEDEGNAKDQPILDVTDSRPDLGQGLLGVRSQGAALSLDNLSVETQQGRWAVGGFALSSEGQNGTASCPGSLSEELGWPAFCLLLLNLNEFVYVD